MATKNKKSKKSQKNNDKGMLLITLLGIVLVAVIVFGVLVIKDQLNSQKEPENENSDTNTAVLYNSDDSETEPTNDGDAVYDEKDVYDASNQQTQVERDENGLKIANTVLSINQNDQMIIFSARITNFLEEGGKCNYVLTKGTEMVTYTKGVLPDPKTTVCESLILEKKTLSAGEWKVKVEYESNDAEGSSEAQSFTM